MQFRSVVLSVLVVAGAQALAAEPQVAGPGGTRVEPVSDTRPDKARGEPPTSSQVSRVRDAAANEGGLTAGGGSGACCLPGGTCQLLAAEADCLALGGQFQGGGSSCGFCDGVCCTSGGFCIDPTTKVECTAASGLFIEEGGCGSCPRACCVPDGSCQIVNTLEDCQVLSGLFRFAGSTCDSCPGACCLHDGSCIPNTSSRTICFQISEARAYLGGAGCEDCAGACCRSNGTCAVSRRRGGRLHLRCCRQSTTARVSRWEDSPLRLRCFGSACANWRSLNGSNLLPEVIQGVRFVDGLKQQAA